MRSNDTVSFNIPVWRPGDNLIMYLGEIVEIGPALDFQTPDHAVACWLYTDLPQQAGRR
jgi:hypothetical protein